MEFETEEEYIRKYDLLRGPYRFNRDRLLDQYETNQITLEVFLERFKTEAAPSLENQRRVALLLVSGLVIQRE